MTPLSLRVKYDCTLPHLYPSRRALPLCSFCPLSSPALLSKTFEPTKMSSNSINNSNFNLSYEDALDLGLSQGQRIHSNQSHSLHSASSSQPSGTQSSVSTNSSQNQHPNNLHPATYNSYLSAPTQNSGFHPNGGFHPTQRFLSHQGIQYPVPPAIHHPPSQGSSTSSVTSVFVPTQDQIHGVERHLQACMTRMEALEAQLQVSRAQSSQLTAQVSSNHQQLLALLSNQRPVAPNALPDQVPPIREGSVPMAPSSATPVQIQSSTPHSTSSTVSNGNQKLAFDKLTEAVRTNTQRFDDWQQSVIRRTMINSDTRSAVDPNTLTFLPTMDSFQSLKVYDALATSIIPNLPSTYISASQKKNNDATALFAALLKIYGTEARTVVTSLKAQKAFTNISKDTATSMDKYFSQFKESLTHSQLTMSQQELAVHYLTSLNQVSLTDIIFAISENERKQWWTQGLEHTHHKAVEYLKSVPSSAPLPQKQKSLTPKDPPKLPGKPKPERLPSSQPDYKKILQDLFPGKTHFGYPTGEEQKPRVQMPCSRQRIYTWSHQMPPPGSRSHRSRMGSSME